MAYSRFNYISTSGLAAYIPTMSGVTNHELAAQFISDAELMIDAYVGKAPKFYSDLTGDVTNAIAADGVTVSATVFGPRRSGYWAQGGNYLKLTNIPGSGNSPLVGQKRLIVRSVSGEVTLASGFGTNLAPGVQFVMQQESAFPRWYDSDPWGTPELPDMLDVAVAWQVEYGILYGSESYGLGTAAAVTGEDEAVQSRTYASGYSESRAPGVAGGRAGLSAWVAPKARAILRGIIAATGRLWA